MVPNFALFYEIKIFSQSVFALTHKTVFLKNTKISEGNFALTHKSENNLKSESPPKGWRKKHTFFMKKSENHQTPTATRVFVFSDS